MERETALALVKERVSNKNLISHMLSVGAIMRSLAKEVGEDEGLWEATGILHDIDYEETKDDFSRHSLVSAEILQGKLPETAIRAIKSHNFENTGIRPESRMDYALICSDALSGLLVACALVMPSKKLAEVTPDSIDKKFRSKDFARNVSRANIDLCGKLGLSREKFFGIGLDAMKNVAREIGL